MALTLAKIRTAQPREKTYKLIDGRGLYLQITPSGGRWWRFRYRFGSKQNTLSMGVYPETSLETARNRRDEARKLLVSGINPSDQRKSQRAAQRAEQERQEATKFILDNEGALSIRIGSRRLTFNSAETAELRAFLDATRAVRPRVKR